MQQKNTKCRSPKTVLRLPGLDHSKSSMLQTLGSVASQKTYAFAIDDFISWYCSEPRLAFGRPFALRYRYYFESRQLASRDALFSTFADPVEPCLASGRILARRDNEPGQATLV